MRICLLPHEKRKISFGMRPGVVLAGRLTYLATDTGEPSRAAPEAADR